MKKTARKFCSYSNLCPEGMACQLAVENHARHSPEWAEAMQVAYAHAIKCESAKAFAAFKVAAAKTEKLIIARGKDEATYEAALAAVDGLWNRYNKAVICGGACAQEASAEISRLHTMRVASEDLAREARMAKRDAESARLTAEIRESRMGECGWDKELRLMSGR